MNNCRMCLAETELTNDLSKLQTELKNIVETLFSGKIKIEPYSQITICEPCQGALLNFYQFYEKALRNQIEYERLVSQSFDEILVLDGEEDIKVYSEPLAIIKEDKSPPPPKQKTQKPLKVDVESDEDEEIKETRKPPKTEVSEEDEAVKGIFGLVCSICPNTEFPKYTLYKRHLRKFHGNRNPVLSCCGKNFYKRVRIVDHALFHTDPGRFKCQQCGKQKHDRTSLKEHLVTHDPTSECKVCDLCGSRFYSITNLRAHMRVHLSKEEKARVNVFKCSQCTYRSAVKSILAAHVRIVHDRMYARICEVCAQPLKTKQAFKDHMAKVHGPKDTTPAQCPTCGEVRPNRASLMHHIRMYHNDFQPTSCKLCGKELLTKYSMKGHKEYCPAIARVFKCKICGHEYKTRNNLRDHVSAIHKGTPTKCTYCDKLFNCSGNMYSHRKKMHPLEYVRDYGKKNLDKSNREGK